MRLLPADASADLPPLSRVQSVLAKRSLAHFVRAGWRVLEPNTTLEWNWHLDAVAEHVQALYELRLPKRNLLINVPPGSMKSLIVSVFGPAWNWLHRPWFGSIHASANPRVTVRDSMKCRRLIESEWYMESFRPGFAFDPTQNAKTLFKNTKGGFRQALSAGQKVTGDRAHGLFWDDLLDAADAESLSPVKRKAINRWYDTAYHNRLADPNTGIRCGICQRLAEDDPAGHVLEQGDYEALIIPQVYEPPKRTATNPTGAKPRTALGWSDPRELPGELMFPRRFGSKFLRGERRVLGEAMFDAQHQQRPVPLGGLMFKREWWGTVRMPPSWESMDVAALCQAMGITRIVTGWDTALSEKRSADYTSACTIGERAQDYIVLESTLERMGAPALKVDVAARHARWRAHAVPIEGGGSASGKAIVQLLKAESRVPAIEVPNIDKFIRAQRVAPTVEAKRVVIPEDAPWRERFLTSLCSFPRGAHDDDVDAFDVAMEYLLFGETSTGLLDFYRDEAAKARAGA